MAILPYQTIKVMCEPGLVSPLVHPFHEQTKCYGLTYGCGPASYDVRVAEAINMTKGDFILASTVERFEMPNDVQARVQDKSSLVRRGLHVHNSLIDPGWRGFLTLELVFNGPVPLELKAGSPIAQVVFERLEAPTAFPYCGKYQDQGAGPQAARDDKSD